MEALEKKVPGDLDCQKDDQPDENLLAWDRLPKQSGQGERCHNGSDHPRTDLRV
jgi:hypothetical protein